MRRAIRNPTDTTVTTALVIVALAGMGTALVVTALRPVSLPSLPPLKVGSTGPAPQGTAPEPEEGYEARWQARRAQALRSCRQNPQIQTWPQAVTCALQTAFPEAAPWTDPAGSEGWIADAAAYVEADMVTAVAERFGVDEPTSWQATLWIRGPREIQRCRTEVSKIAEIQLCVASTLFPNETWPSTQAGWQASAWKAIRNLILPPIGGSSA